MPDEAKAPKAPLIIYVDDESANRIVFDAAFKNMFRLAIASSGEEALKLLAAEQPAVVVSDQRMPGMTGLELLNRVKELSPDTERIVLTAYSDQDPMLDAINRVKVGRYVVKPWDKKELAAVLTGAVEAYGIRRQMRELEVQLIDAQRSEVLGRLAGGLVHDMASPLASIVANAERLRDGTALFKEVAAALKAERRLDDAEALTELPDIANDLTNAAKYLTSLVSGLREYWRPPSSSAAAANPKVVLQFVSSVVGARARELDVELRFDSPDLPMVRLSAPELCQLLVNLVVNACQAFPKDWPVRRVTVAAKALDGGVEISVSDTGKGIPLELLEQLGTRQITTKPVGEGTGLGVMVCRAMVERARGRFTLHSTQSVGTVARAWLPLAT